MSTNHYLKKINAIRIINKCRHIKCTVELYDEKSKLGLDETYEQDLCSDRNAILIYLGSKTFNTKYPYNIFNYDIDMFDPYEYPGQAKSSKITIDELNAEQSKLKGHKVKYELFQLAKAKSNDIYIRLHGYVIGDIIRYVRSSNTSSEFQPCKEDIYYRVVVSTDTDI